MYGRLRQSVGEHMFCWKTFVSVTFTWKPTAASYTTMETHKFLIKTTATSPVTTFPALVICFMFLISAFIAFSSFCNVITLCNSVHRKRLQNKNQWWDSFRFRLVFTLIPVSVLHSSVCNRNIWHLHYQIIKHQLPSQCTAVKCFYEPQHTQTSPLQVSMKHNKTASCGKTNPITASSPQQSFPTNPRRGINSENLRNENL